jgi:hypothetical protein
MYVVIVGGNIMPAVSRLRFPWCSFYSFILYFSGISFVSTSLAVDFNQGDLHGSFDTTVSYGQSYRMQSRASELTGIANGGTAFSVNGDDGNLNYDSGLISSTMKFTSELDLRYKNFGAFIRGTGFKDFRNDDRNDTERTPLSDKAMELVGEDLKLLDAYIWSDFNLGQMPFNIRLGEQVLSWGESTFIQNSINTINPVDVSKLRVPGAELKEALVPVGIVSASAGLTDSFTLEGFYQYDYERVLIDPTGSYFSTNDFVGYGGTCAVLGFGLPLLGPGVSTDYPLLGIGSSATACDLGLPFAAPRAGDDRPEEGGQYGAALRWFSSLLNNTEFGFYFINYHSRLPLINAFQAAAPGVASTAAYQIGYPEDIKLYGISFNTELGTTGWALQGEYSFRSDAPLQIDDAELLLAALGSPANQLGVTWAPGSSFIPGFIRRDVSQFQMTASRIFGPMLKASQAILVTEFAVTHIHDMPDRNTLRLEAPGTNLPGPFLGLDRTGFGLGVQPNGDFADATSWGYRIVGRLDYNNVVGSINLHPRIEWRHDVSGITPGPGGNFVEGAKVVTAGLGATYQNVWQADLSYTSFFGAGSQNLLLDRDFLSLSVSYSF